MTIILYVDPCSGHNFQEKYPCYRSMQSGDSQIHVGVVIGIYSDKRKVGYEDWETVCTNNRITKKTDSHDLPPNKENT